MTEEFESELPVDLSDIWPRIVAGADWDEYIQFLDDNEDPLDTTDWDMEITIVDTDNETQKTLTVGSGITHTAALGLFEFIYTAADTALLKCQRVKIRVKVTDADGGIDYVAHAILEVFHLP